MKSPLPLAAAALTLTLFALPAPAQEFAGISNDWLLIPDRRAGPITKEWTGDDLMRAFGTLHCKREEIPVGEGFSETGYRIYAGTEDEIEVMISPETGKVDRVVVQLKFEEVKDAAGEWIGSRIVPRKSRWHSISGITLGSNLADVTKVNGGPFTIEGWEIDYPGAVSDWRGGKIPASFHARFQYADQETYGKWWEKVTGGGAPWDGSSDAASLAELKLTVYHLTIDL